MSAPKRIRYKGQIYEAIRTRPLSDILKNKDFSVIVVPDARYFDIHEWERMIGAEEDDDDNIVESLLEEDEKKSGEKFTVTKDDVQNILNKIASSDQFVAPYYKTRGFMKANNLSTDDVKAIVSQLTPSDYNHSVTSKTFKPGDVLTVFITNKDFEVNGKQLYGSKLYIKVDADYGDMVAIVSIHTNEERKNSRPNPHSSSAEDKK